MVTPEQIRNAPASRTTGYFYQWGKRKPWPATGAVSGWSTASNTNPDAAGYNSDRAAWGAGGAKTVADPCPAGWRVPSALQMQAIYADGAPSSNHTGPRKHTVNTWQMVDGATNILMISPFLAVPVQGIRAHDGSIGYYPHINYATRDGSADNWELLDNYFRAIDSDNLKSNAYPIRCVAE